MKACSLAFVLVLGFLNQTAFGQSHKTKESFPTYDQIRQKEQGDYDYVNRDGSARTVKIDSLILFGYPPGSVTYILNGKPLPTENAVKRELAENAEHIEQISIRKSEKTGKRVIRITYE